MKFLLTLAVVAAVAADVKAVVIPDTASASLSTTKRKGCGRRAHTYSASPAYSAAPTTYSQSMASSSSEFVSSSLVASYTTSSDITSSTITTTQSTVAPSSVTTSSESSTETASTVSDTTESTSSATESATETPTTVSSTISTSASTTESSSSESTSEASTTESSTESSTEASTTVSIASESITEASTTESTTESSSTVSSTVSAADASVTESTTEASATTSFAIPTTDSTSTDITPTTSTAAATCVATNTVDGGFEDGTPTSEWTRSSQAYIESNDNNAYTTPYGSWFAVLYGQRLNTATISQTLSDVSPSSTLSFSYRLFGILNSPLANCAITVSYAGTTLESVTYTYSNALAANAGWQTVTLPVENAPSSGTLAFAWTCNLYATSTVDLGLDNVYLTKSTSC